MTQSIDAHHAKRLIESKAAVLIDIREPAEHARENIPGAVLVPLSQFPSLDLAHLKARAPAAIFHCQGGNRTKGNAARLSACGFPTVYVLQDGIAGWKAAGLPTAVDKTHPIELQRQVQIAAGALVMIGLFLAIAVSPWFAALAGFVGAGLTFAGITGWCGMARLLRAMPWNRVAVS